MSAEKRERNEKVTSEGMTIDGLYNGLPYEGPILHIKHDDPPHMLPRLVAAVTIDVFMMDDPDDVKKYKDYMEDMGRGWADISREDVEWVPRRETWKIFLRMMHKKYIQPEDICRAEDK